MEQYEANQIKSIHFKSFFLYCFTTDLIIYSTILLLNLTFKIHKVGGQHRYTALNRSVYFIISAGGNNV